MMKWARNVCVPRRHEFLRVQNGETLCGIGRPVYSVSQKSPSAAGTSFQCPASEQGMIDCLAILANTIIREKGEGNEDPDSKRCQIRLRSIDRPCPVRAGRGVQAWPVRCGGDRLGPLGGNISFMARAAKSMHASVQLAGPDCGGDVQEPCQYRRWRL